MKNKLDIEREFQEKLEEIIAQIKRPTLLLCGYTGAGKTTLAQKIFGKNMIPDEDLKPRLPGRPEYKSYHNENILLWDSKGLEPGSREKDFVKVTRDHLKQFAANADADRHIHLVWYCIQGEAGRITQTDLELIKSMGTEVIIVITRLKTSDPERLEALKQSLMSEGISRRNIVTVDSGDSNSLKRLINHSLERLPPIYCDAFISAQQIDLEKKKARAQLIIHGAAANAAVAGASPLPFAHANVITPIQIGMIATLALNYGMPTEQLKASSVPMLTEVAGIYAATSLTKHIPGFETVISGTIADALTEAAGQSVNQYYIACQDSIAAGEPVPQYIFSLTSLLDLFTAAQSRAKRKG